MIFGIFLTFYFLVRNFRYGSDKNGTGTKKCSTARVKFYSVNDFAVPNFTHAWTFSKGSPSTGKIGTGAGNTSPARIKCIV